MPGRSLVVFLANVKDTYLWERQRYLSHPDTQTDGEISRAA